MSTSIIPAQRTPRGRLAPALEKLARGLLCTRLKQLADGSLTILEGGRRTSFGRAIASDDPAVELTVLDGRFWGEVAFGGSLGAAESYIAGDWTASDLTGLVRLLVRNRAVLENLDRGLARLTTPTQRLLHYLNRNTHSGSRRNIAAHYDLGNAFFERMLDPTMAYSSAIFPTPDTSLHAAQLHKFDTICRKLALSPNDHLLEIGTGWGGLAIHAARHFGCRVTTTTISREQHDYAREAIAREGLGDRITLLLEDYRDLKGSFDKLVSIEMIEAVGHRFLDTYMGTLSARLQPHGMALLQAITLQDQYYEAALKAVDFIQKHVFPGSFIPSLNAISQAVTRSTDLKIFHLEDIGPHYARTLAAWRHNVFRDPDAIRAMGYPEEFLRLWEFYLCYCEGGFAERQIGDLQILLTKPRCRRPPIVAERA
jgi:cyclopropane-fatty-acyl-phospholipid synthase